MKLMLLLLVIPAAVLYAAEEIVASFDAPDTGNIGLAYSGDKLYVLASYSQTVYRLNPATGGERVIYRGLRPPAEAAEGRTRRP